MISNIGSRFLFLFCFVRVGFADKSIGAIFDDGSFILEAVFNVAITAASVNMEDPFAASVVRTSPGDLLESQKAMCSLLENNIFAIVGPVHKTSIQHVQSIADSLEIPQIITQPVETQNRNWSAVNLYPYHNSYSQVFADIIEMKGWVEFTVIYEGAELLPFLDNILTMQDLDSGPYITMYVVQLPDGDDFRSQMKAIKNSGSVNYVVDCTLEKLPQLLQQAQQVGIMSDDHSYIIMNPDFQTIDIETFKHGGSNITGVRFFDPTLEAVQNLIKAVNEKVVELSEGQIENAVSENALTLNLALVYDAVTLYTSVLNALALPEGPALSCDSTETWSMGSTVLNYMKTIEIDGLSGIIKFDEDGFRSDFEIEVLEIMAHGFEKIGKWKSEDGFEEERIVIPPAESEGSESMKGKHFIVLTALSAPYGMLKESTVKLEGNDRYEGFGIELIQELAKMNEFNFTFEIQADGVYGSFDKKTGKWNGMMEKVMDGVIMIIDLLCLVIVVI